MIGAQVFWLAIVCLLGGWWCRLVLTQATRIAQLETGIGMIPEAIAHQLRTQRMVFWESLSYFILLLGSTVVVFWLYWRDVQRSRGIQAFFASMTHELRTPLTSIRLQAESIAENLSHLSGDPRRRGCSSGCSRTRFDSRARSSARSSWRVSRAAARFSGVPGAQALAGSAGQRLEGSLRRQGAI